MLPFIEQGSLYNSFNASIGTEGPGFTGFGVNSTVFTTRITSMQCPSDSSQTLSVASLAPLGVSAALTNFSATKGNYAVNWGNTDNGQWTSSGLFPTLYRASPFGVNQPLTGPQSVTYASVTDGLSNTHFVSELLQGASDDVRGTIWVDDACAGAFQTRFTPNGNQDILQVIGAWSGNGTNNVDNVPGGAPPGTPGFSPAMAGTLCDTQPAQQLACASTSEGGALLRFAKQTSRWREFAVWRRLRPLHKKLDQSADLGRRSGQSTAAR